MDIVIHAWIRYSNRIQGFIQDFFVGEGEKRSRKVTHANTLIKSLNKSHLVMRIAIEGPDLKEVNFNQVLGIFKDQNHPIAS